MVAIVEDGPCPVDQVAPGHPEHPCHRVSLARLHHLDLRDRHGHPHPLRLPVRRSYLHLDPPACQVGLAGQTTVGDCSQEFGCSSADHPRDDDGNDPEGGVDDEGPPFPFTEPTVE
jgi:hypothetical protein